LRFRVWCNGFNAKLVIEFAPVLSVNGLGFLGRKQRRPPGENQDGGADDKQSYGNPLRNRKRADKRLFMLDQRVRNKMSCFNSLR
jgi:hypothetical protein